MQVGYRCPGGCEHGRRHAGELCQAKGQKSRGAFIHPHVQPKPAHAISLLQRVGKRRRSGAGTQDGLTNSEANQLVDNNRSQSGRRIHSDDPATSRPGQTRRTCLTARDRVAPRRV